MMLERVIMRGLLVIPDRVVMGLMYFHCMFGSSTGCGFVVWAVVWGLDLVGKTGVMA